MAGSWKNSKFTLAMSGITYLVVLLMAAALAAVMLMGMPYIGEALSDMEVQFAIRLSLYTSVVSTLLCIFVAVPVAYALARVNLPFKSVINTILDLDLPLALPPIVSGVCLLLLFGTTSFGRWLEGVGLTFVFTAKGIILAQFFVNLPFMIRVMKSTILGVDPRLEFVARTLGCSPARTFLKVTLPLSKNGLLAGTVITWAKALGEFGAALMLAGATRMRTETLPISLFLNMSTGDLELAMAIANLLIIISIVSLFIFDRLGGDLIGKTRGF